LRAKGFLDWRTDRAPVGLRKADDLYDQRLDAPVDREPRSLGQRFASWTRDTLGEYLAEKLNVVVADSTVGRHLRRLGWTLVRPALSIHSPDPSYVVKAAELALRKVRARQGEITLLFEDEHDLNVLPGVIRCWTRVGEQRKIPTPGTHRKRHVFGAVDFVKGALVTHIAERKNSQGCCELVEAIVERYCPGSVWNGPTVVLVVDNYVVHKSKVTRAVLAKYADRLEVFCLPTYSPKLNVIEWIWKYLRSKVTHTHRFASIEALVEAVGQFLMELAADPTKVLSMIGNLPNNQPDPIPSNLCSAG
jgi:putative transposase